MADIITSIPITENGTYSIRPGIYPIGTKIVVEISGDFAGAAVAPETLNGTPHKAVVTAPDLDEYFVLGSPGECSPVFVVTGVTGLTSIKITHTQITGSIS